MKKIFLTKPDTDCLQGNISIDTTFMPYYLSLDVPFNPFPTTGKRRPHHGGRCTIPGVTTIVAGIYTRRYMLWVKGLNWKILKYHLQNITRQSFVTPPEDMPPTPQPPLKHNSPQNIFFLWQL